MVRVNRESSAFTIPVLDIWRAQGQRCFYCNCRLPGNKITRDHLFPRSHGHGLNMNKVAACFRCNNRKGDRAPTAAEIEKARNIYRTLGLPAWDIG